MQCRRCDRFLLRVGAGLAELLLDRVRSGGQAVPNPGGRLRPDPELEPQRKNPHAPGRLEPGHQARGGSEAEAGALPVSRPYRLVKLANGSFSIHSLAHRETFHPVIGPVAEAEALYVRQLDLPKRLHQHSGEFVVWDVGLGAAANPLTVLSATRDIACTIRLVSFDHTLEPLQFALGQVAELDYLSGYESHLHTLLERGKVWFQ